MDKRVSVIVPVYNVEKYLKKCVNSIIHQTYKNLEIILVDDGSPDRSGALCDHLATKDSRIRVIHKKNGGVSSARNAGIEAATGEYICFVDSDDWLPEKAIGILTHRIQKDGSDLCIGAVEIVGIRKSCPWKFQDTCIHIENVYQLLPFEYALKTPWAKLYRTEIIKKERLNFAQGISFGEDTIFVWSYISSCNCISLVNSTTYCYSVLNATNASKKYYKDMIDWQYLYIKELEKAIDRSMLSIHEKRQLVCQAVVKVVLYFGSVYSQHLLLDRRDELFERLHYTVNLFRDYLFDESFELGADMEQERALLKTYVIPEDYVGWMDHYTCLIGKKKKSTVVRLPRNIILWCRRNWVYKIS